MKIKYTARVGNIRYAASNGAAVLSSRSTVLVPNRLTGQLEPVTENESPAELVQQQPLIVQAAFSAIKDIPTRSEADAEFDSVGAVIRYQGETITPETDASTLPDDIAALVNAIYSYNDGEYVDKWRASQVGVDAGPEPLTPEQQKEVQRREIEAEYNARIESLVKGYPPRVRETWPSQEAEARAWRADPAAHTPTLDGIVERSGRDKAALVNSIIEKADYLKYESGKALGDMQAALAAIDPA